MGWILILGTVLFLFVLNILPPLLALVSRKAKGEQKLIWFLLAFFLSWIGYFVYYFLVIRDLPSNNVRRDYAGRTIR